MEDLKTYRYIIQGRVQGVAFRYYTQNAAWKNHISGTVKNLPNGDVEVVAQGEAQDLECFEAYLDVGPPAARVTRVIKTHSTGEPPFNDFSVIY